MPLQTICKGICNDKLFKIIEFLSGDVIENNSSK